MNVIELETVAQGMRITWDQPSLERGCWLHNVVVGGHTVVTVCSHAMEDENYENGNKWIDE